MPEKSRTEYSARNTTVAMIARMMAILMGFFARVVFTHVLNQEYVGINGLFTDILSVLALSELGVGTAITFALYQPIAEKNIEKQKTLMYLYKKFYIMVAAVVLIAGLCIIPFLGVLIKDQPKVDHLILIYLMYLANSVVSYIGIYKRTLIDAHQLSYIGVVYQTSFWVLQNGIQMIVLLTTRNFILYLSILILCTIGNNICISHKADKLYPYLRDKNVKPLPSEEKASIFENIRAMLMHKVGNVVVNNTDNLLLSALVGTLSVGCYSNYFLIIGSIKQVLEQMFQGITASVGNLGVQEKKERIHHIFKATFFMGQWISGVVTITVYEVIDLFVGQSFGQQYVFDKPITFVLCLNLYFTTMRQPTLVFRDSMGLFRYDRYKAIVEAAINLIVSIILGLRFGTIGVFLGTLVSTITTSLWVEPYMLYKHRLQKSCIPYFLKYAACTCVTFALWYGEDLVCRRMNASCWVQCIERAAFCFFVTNAVYLLLYHGTSEFKLLYAKGIDVIRKKLGLQNRKEHPSANADEEQPLRKEQQLLVRLLAESLTQKETEQEMRTLSAEEWNSFLACAEAHAVLPIIADQLQNMDIPEAVSYKALISAKKAVSQSYRFLMLDKYLVNLFQEKGIPVVILKGVATGSLYPIPEVRKSGDVDLLLLIPEQIEEATEVMTQAGFRVQEIQPSHHHVVFQCTEGFEIELHTQLAEPFDNHKMNQYMDQCLKNSREQVEMRDVCGIQLPVLADSYHAFELLLHMLQHFLRAGFGLKLLCDWVVFWNREIEPDECSQYLELVNGCGLKGFSDMITAVCFSLGLEENKVAWMDISVHSPKSFLQEIMVSEEFGKSSKDRMVALRGNGLTDYVREFHHQMHLNFPKTGRVFLLWPILWMITLLRFLNNNRKLRKVSTFDVFKKAGQRGRLMKEMKLFRK